MKTVLNSIKTTLDVKKHTQKINMHIVASKDGTTIDFKADTSSKFKKTDEKITLPPKGQIISFEDFQKKFTENPDVAQTTDQTIPEETFNQLYDTVNSQKDYVSRAKLDEALADVMPLLTDEQKQKLEEILPNE